jgi:hypothetical protein
LPKRSLAFPFTLAVTLASNAAAAQMPLVGEDAIAPAARACLGLSSDFDAVRRQLGDQGWARGKYRTADGKALRDPGTGVEVYGREGLLLLLTTDPGKPGCVISAKAKSGLHTDKLVSDASAIFGKAPFASAAGQAMWRLESGQAIMLRHQVAPVGASIQIVFTPTEKKI